MQPQEPSTPQMPPAQVTPATVPPQAARGPVQAPAQGGAPGSLRTRKSRVRLWLALAGGVMALLCLGGVGVIVSLYDSATKIDRASPDQVTSSFLRAYLVDRNDKEAELFICKRGPQLDVLAALRSEMINREKNYGTTVTASWESLRVTDSGQNTKSVAADLAITGSSKGQQVSSHTEAWTFGLVDEAGWRVCSATKVS